MRNHCGNYHDHDDDDVHNDDNCYCFDCYDDFIVIMLIMMLIMMMIVMVFFVGKQRMGNHCGNYYLRPPWLRNVSWQQSRLARNEH